MKSIDMKATGLNLYFLIRDSGRTTKDIEEACGVTRQTVNKWINGRRLPSIDNIVILADMFNIDVGGYWCVEMYKIRRWLFACKKSNW